MSAPQAKPASAHTISLRLVLRRIDGMLSATDLHAVQNRLIDLATTVRELLIAENGDL